MHVDENIFGSGRQLDEHAKDRDGFSISVPSNVAVRASLKGTDYPAQHSMGTSLDNTTL